MPRIIHNFSTYFEWKKLIFKLWSYRCHWHLLPDFDVSTTVEQIQILRPSDHSTPIDL